MIAAQFLLRRNLIRHRRSRRILALGVLEDEGVVESDFLDERAGLLKILLRLARESDDDVGRDQDAGLHASQLGDDFEITLASVAPVHLFQQTIRSRLYR